MVVKRFFYFAIVVFILMCVCFGICLHQKWRYARKMPISETLRCSWRQCQQCRVFEYSFRMVCLNHFPYGQLKTLPFSREYHITTLLMSEPIKEVFGTTEERNAFGAYVLMLEEETGQQWGKEALSAWQSGCMDTPNQVGAFMDYVCRYEKALNHSVCLAGVLKIYLLNTMIHDSSEDSHVET